MFSELLNVGSPFVLGMMEDSLEHDIKSLAEESRYSEIGIDDVDFLLDKYNTTYFDLPEWMQEEIDRIELSEGGTI